MRSAKEFAEAAKIARALSQPQRAAILWCHANGSPREHEKGAPPRVSFYYLASVIKGDPTKTLAQHYKLVVQGKGSKPPGHVWPEDTWALTPLGLAVRAHLLRTQPRNEERSARS